MGPLIFLIMSIICVLLVKNSINQQSLTRNKIFNQSGSFTIGRVVRYSARTYGPNGVGSSPFIDFSYEVDGVKLTSQSDYSVPNENGPKSGGQFLAIYLPKAPGNCLLLLDYPIKDSADYKRNIEEFKVHPIKLDKK